MKRSRSFADGRTIAESSLPPPRPLKRASLSADFTRLPHSSSLGFAPSEAAALPRRQRSAAASPSGSSSSRETWPVEQAGDPDGTVRSIPHQLTREQDASVSQQQAVMQRVASSESLTLKDVAFGAVDAIAARMQVQPDELLEALKAELRQILNGTGGIQQKEEFALLQKHVLARRDFTPNTLMRVNKAQLEILVAIKTGIPAFLHPDISVTQSVLIDVFLYKRCRNMACQTQLPGDDCACEVCSSKSGFCNTCMCTICCKFDFDVNTCRWIGCDFCSHWAHTDCAIKVGQIAMGPLLRGAGAVSGMLFKCGSCKHMSELLGWVKDVFANCAGDWGRAELLREFDSVRRIFYGSEDSKGRRLFRKTEEMLEKLKTGAESSTVCKDMQTFFNGLETEDMQQLEKQDAKGGAGAMEACGGRIAEVVQQAIAKMDTVAEEKARALKKARAAMEASEREVEERRREVEGAEAERRRKQQKVEELEAIVRLKVAEGDMFQAHADRARREADELQRMAAHKSEKVEEEYTARYLQLRLHEVETERRALFEKIQMQEYSSPPADAPPDAAQILLACKIQDLLQRVYGNNSAHDPPPQSSPPHPTL